MNTHVPSPQTRTATTTNAMSPLPPEKILKTTQARTARMANVMGYLYFRINLFISWHFHDGRHMVLAVQDSTARQIRAQHQLEVACRCRQPVGLVPGWSRALHINVDGAISVRHEAGATADAVAIDGVAHHVPDHIGHGQRPECPGRRELSDRKMQDVLALAREPSPRTID